MDKGLKRGISVVFIANILNLLFSLLRNFLLPKYLPIESYAEIKTYQLYISYSGLFALGYIDGMYLKYGGKNVSDINLSEFSTNLSTFRIFQILIAGINVCVAIALQSPLLCLVAITIPFLTIVDYYKCFFQAVGEFSVYSKILNSSSILTFCVSMLLLLVLKIDDAISYIVAFTIIYGLVLLIVESYFYLIKKYRFNFLSFSFSELKENIITGFSLMVSLLISNFMTGLDRWFVKFTLDTISFARYSFAASVLGFLSYAISPISITMYNYFCKHSENKKINDAKEGIILFSTVIIALAFPIKFILEFFLQEYLAAIIVIFVLFAEQVPNSIVRCLYVNLYKATKQQSKFLKKVVLVVIAGVVLNIVAYLITKKMEGYAVATAISSIIWMILCIRDFNEFGLSNKELIYLAIAITSFLLCGLFLTSYFGLLVYLIVLTISLKVFIPSSIKIVVSFLPSSLKHNN